jgi:pimeloyl-ACP methyl ester carboxylesterase
VAERAPSPGDRIAVPTAVLWPDHDPLFPFDWSDRVGDFFAAATLTRLNDAGHYTPLERPEEFATAVITALNSGRR